MREFPLDERTLREIYLVAFEAAVKDANVASVMASYNKVNGIHVQEVGRAIASVLFGDFNPCGHLPITFPSSHDAMSIKSVEQYPGKSLDVHYSEGLFVGYRWFDKNHIKPLFPFGFGLSYTTFTYTDMQVTWLQQVEESIIVSVRVSNTGEPPKQLKGFHKVPLAPGESKFVEFCLGWRSFAIWSEGDQWEVKLGEYQIMIGDSSENILVQRSIVLSDVPDNLSVWNPLNSSRISI